MHVKMLNFLMFIPQLQHHADTGCYRVVKTMVSRFYRISDYYRFPFILFFKIPEYCINNT